jgi:predicted nucleotidyltransferase
MPLFRSRALVAVLEQLYVVETTTDRSISDIARSSGVPYATTQREINRLADAGLIKTRTVGRSRLVTVEDDHAASPSIRTLMMLAAGPRSRIAKALEDLDGIQEAYVHGSWADRYLGTWGDAPADIDVLIVGDVDQQDLYERLQPVETALGIPVNPTVVSPHDWEASGSGFLKSVADGPLVPIVDSSEEDNSSGDRSAND